jgi:hypothetical protein
MGTLAAFRSNVYSQAGEDGVLAEILGRLRIESGYFVEFGASHGRNLSNTFRLAESGWRGVYIEGEPGLFPHLEESVRAFEGRVSAINAWVQPTGESSLDALLESQGVPRDLELLSIDVDSYDWNIWLHLSGYQPIIVVLEINSSVPPGIVQTHRSSDVQGCSFSAAVLLARAKGYSIVCHTGNVIMVRDDHVAALDLPAEELQFPELLFEYKWVVGSRHAASTRAQPALHRRIAWFVRSRIRRAGPH